MIEQDLGVEVKVHDRVVGGDHSSSMLVRLRKDSELRELLRQADVITFLIPWQGFSGSAQKRVSGAPGACGGADNEDCLREALEIYLADTDQIFAEIVSLRSPSEALIRAMDTYQHRAGDLKESGLWEVVNPYWHAANAHVIEVATSYHIPVAPVYDAFMGVDGVKDPRDLGLLVSDGIHPTQKGQDLMAELFRQLGYEYAPAAE
jgi:hypothetical protein